MGFSSPTPIRAVLRCGEPAPAAGWARWLVHTRVAGLSLLERHLRAFRYAGIRHVTLVVGGRQDQAGTRSRDLEELEQAATHAVPPGLELTIREDAAAGADDFPILEQSANTIVDARLLRQLVRSAGNTVADIVCVDKPVQGDGVEAKSPYKAGVPEPNEARPVDDPADRGMIPIGLVVRAAVAGPAVAFDIGRYYWHRMVVAADVRVATRKILLSTMKATDGFFARTNRRVSLRITRLLLDTPATPNSVTIATLVWGLLAGWLLSRTTHPTFVLGALFAWFASMLDGVDGELARARFEMSAFGHWLEMVCDYVFYIALFFGLGVRVERLRDEPAWLLVGVAASIGVIVSFTMVARLKRAYARQGSMGDFYLAYQRTATAPGSNLFLRWTPNLMALMTRAGFPYLLTVIALFDMPRGLLIAICIATHGFWMVALYVSRFPLTLARSERRFAVSRNVTPQHVHANFPRP